MLNKIYPGKVLLDIDGKRVQAHGGSLFYENGTYYFYGENKEKTDGKSKIWTYGIRCYSSKDLCNWKDEGLIIPPDLENKKSVLHPYQYLDRPHIIKSKKTNKYVCWVKFCGKGNYSFAILVADKFLGPYKLIKDNYRPFNFNAGDFDILEYKGRYYIYFDNLKENIIASELNEECTEVIGNCRTYYDGLVVPYVREGVALFERNDEIFMFTSGMTSYVPNMSRVAKLSSPLGELIDLGNPHLNDESDASFHSQISDIFVDPNNKDLIIALADRRIPSLKFKKGENKRIMNAIAACCSRKYKAKLKDIFLIPKLPLNAKKVNTSIADYVWLPVKFLDNKPIIEWYDEWNKEDIVKK